MQNLCSNPRIIKQYQLRMSLKARESLGTNGWRPYSQVRFHRVAHFSFSNSQVFDNLVHFGGIYSRRLSAPTHGRPLNLESEVW
jgi:hypothetical protein